MHVIKHLGWPTPRYVGVVTVLYFATALVSGLLAIVAVFAFVLISRPLLAILFMVGAAFGVAISVAAYYAPRLWRWIIGLWQGANTTSGFPV